VSFQRTGARSWRPRMTLMSQTSARAASAEVIGVGMRSSPGHAVEADATPGVEGKITSTAPTTASIPARM
jgi:hypothetical protein